MATYRKSGRGWRAEIARAGTRISKTFSTKAQAVAWATQTEAELISRKKGTTPDKTFSEALDKYAREISINKKSRVWEERRIKNFKKQRFADKRISDISDTDFTDYKDHRLETVSAGTVNREFNLLSNIFTVMIRDWKWLKENPIAAVRRPKNPPPRDRLITEDEINRLIFVSGYEENSPCETVSSKVIAAFLFAIETAMRAGEIVKLNWPDINKDKRTAKLYNTKNGTDREVPLSQAAIRILDQLPKDSESVFGLTTSSLDAVFRKMRDKCGIENLHFHDTRHEAITRLAKKLDVLPLARMVGHKDLKMLQIYYNEKAEELAKLLD